MPRRRGTEKRTMSEQMLVRLPGPLASAVTLAAHAEGLTAAAWLRGLAVARLEGAPEHVRPTAPAYEPSLDLEALGLLSRKVSRANGALIQLAKAVRETGTLGHAELEENLAALRSLRRDLTDVVEEARHARRGDTR